MKKKVIAYAYEFQEMDLSKDIFLIPYYVAKELGMCLDYVICEDNGLKPLPQEHRGAHFLISSSKNDVYSMFNHIVRKAREYNVLFLKGSCLKHMVVVWMYKKLNPQGKVMVLGDMESPQAREFNETDFLCSKGAKGIVKKYFVDFFMNNVAYLVANTEAYNEMTKLCGRHHWSGLLHFYPCLDDEKFNEYGMVRRSWEEKENVMVCVGRIGNHQKNTEMLLDALKKVDLKDWKIYMIGPITSSFDLKEGGEFQNVIDKFFAECPQHKDRLIFTGMIYDQKEVFKYYNKAKVLLMTSRHESWGNVYSEAAALGCYILSTNVGGAQLCSNNWLFGKKIKHGDSEGLALAIQNFVDGKTEVNSTNSLPLETLSYSIKTKDVLLKNMGIESSKMVID